MAKRKIAIYCASFFLVLCILAGAGCQTDGWPRDWRTKANELVGVVNIWSSPDAPSLTFIITKDGAIYFSRFTGGKDERSIFLIPNERKESIASLIARAYQELKEAKQLNSVGGGANLSIGLGPNDDVRATVRGYAPRFYHIPSWEALSAELKNIVPERYWRDLQ